MICFVFVKPTQGIPLTEKQKYEIQYRTAQRDANRQYLPKASLGAPTIEERADDNPFFFFENTIINKNFVSYAHLIDGDKRLEIGGLAVFNYDDPNTARNKFHELKKILNPHMDKIQ